MFSYRHAFHAGSHADVLKHMILIAILRQLTKKPTALTVIDTHAAAGLYRLDGDYADASGEAAAGVLKLFNALNSLVSGPAIKNIAPLLADYLAVVAHFNPPGQLKIYPGSPFIAQHLLRNDSGDRLKLFEMHSTDSRVLARNVAQLKAGRQVSVARQDGFAELKALLPPPSRRALVLIDPSYEIKSDYARVGTCLADSVKRFATGTYAIWYPIIPRFEAHELPRRLKKLAQQTNRPWLHATLSVGHSNSRNALSQTKPRQGLTASGVFVLNPPYTLKAGLQEALPQLLQILGDGRGQGQTLEVGNT